MNLPGMSWNFVMVVWWESCPGVLTLLQNVKYVELSSLSYSESCKPASDSCVQTVGFCFMSLASLHLILVTCPVGLPRLLRFIYLRSQDTDQQDRSPVSDASYHET